MWAIKRIVFLPVLMLASTMVEAEDSKKVELQHFWKSPGEKMALEQVVIHAKESGVDMDVFANEDYNSLRESISNRLSLDYPPEMTHWIGGEDLSMLADSGSLLPLPETLNGEALGSILKPEVIADVTSKGQLIALPVGIHLQSIAVYNMDLLAKAGYSKAPDSWESYFELTEKLVGMGIQPVAVSDELWMLRETLHGILSGIGQKQALVDVYAEFDKRGELLANLTKVFDVLLRLRDYADPEHVGRRWSEAVRMVVDGKAASVFIGDFARSEIAYGQDGLSTDNILCAPLPGKQVAYFGVDIFVMFNNGNESWRKQYDKLVSVVLNPDTQKDYLAYKGGLSVLESVDVKQFNQCSRLSSAIWTDNPTQRFSSPGPRDNQRIALLHEVLPAIWTNRNMRPDEAAQLVYDKLASDRFN